jgi:GDP-L-fucose synthase
LYVEDLAYIFEWFIENEPKYHDYNIATGQPISLENIAKIVAEQMNNSKNIQIAQQGWNKEYTADNSRLLNEMKDFNFTTITEGIAKQIKWQLTEVFNV